MNIKNNGLSQATEASEINFSGTIFLLHAFDIADGVDLVKMRQTFETALPRAWQKHFRHFHIPLAIEKTLGHHPDRVDCFRSNVHHFGAVSLMYKIPFNGTLESLRTKIDELSIQYRHFSTEDIQSIFKKIEPYTTQGKCFHHRTSYVVAHLNPLPEETLSGRTMITKYGALIASALRFETTNLSEFQAQEILQSTTGYYQNDLVIIDTEAAFVYDKDADELLDFFEQALVQQLELQYFDKLLDSKLDAVYNRAIQQRSWFAYLPFIGTVYDPLSELSKLKVDISVITERLNNSIKLAGEPYYSRIYELLTKKFEVDNWRISIEKKLGIVRDVLSIYQNKVNSIREDILSVLIIILITIEVTVAILK